MPSLSLKTAVLAMSLTALSVPPVQARPTAGEQAKSTTAAAEELAGYQIQPSRRMGFGGPWDYEIQVALPPSYGKTKKAFPVLWVTDGGGAFRPSIKEVSRVADKGVPEMIIVGIGAPPEATDAGLRRQYDFTITPDGLGFPGLGGKLSDRIVDAAFSKTPLKHLGGAPQFLDFLISSVRPALAREFRMANDHTLTGHSGGGHFCGYAIFARPGAFQRYICTSPSLYTENNLIFSMEEAYAEKNSDMSARIFFAAGEAEMLQGGVVSSVGCVSSMARMVEILGLRNYPSLRLEARIYPGKDHGTVWPVAKEEGLIAVFR